MNPFIKLDKRDNVVIALKDLSKGIALNIDNAKIILKEDIKQAHKIAIETINNGENIVKYGMPIGHANSDIEVGSHVHTHNVDTNLSDIIKYSYEPKFETVENNIDDREVSIYRRNNGDIGIRNELYIVPTVGCVNQVAKNMVKQLEKQVDLEFIDGVHVFTHQYGCSQMGDDHENTKVTLQNIVKHPNAGAVLVVGLGCENNQVKEFKETLGDYDQNRVKFLITQEVEDEVSTGVEILKELVSVMKEDKRGEGKLSELKFGLECGGSDGFSGITANPLLGRFSDYIITLGGTSVLTEVPEMFGAETILMQRAKDKKTYDKIAKMINNFKEYYQRHNQVIYDNPSPGNKKGGITTLEDKSLGCTQKAGLSCVNDVLEYNERLKVSGLNLLTAPGNDLIATTALGMAGCHLVLFTTGRGTPFGGFVPTVKISTNTNLATKKRNWIDFDAGRLVDDVTMDQLLIEFIDYIVDVVNGKKTKNEINDFREIAIFKSGVTL